MKKKTTTFEQFRQLAERSNRFTNKLNGELAQAVTEAVMEIENLKADKAESVSVTIPTSGWNSDNTAVYPYFYDLKSEGITVNDIAEIVILPESMSTAVECGICPTNQTFTNKIRIRSAKIPGQQIKAEYNIHCGKE